MDRETGEIPSSFEGEAAFAFSRVARCLNPARNHGLRATANCCYPTGFDWPVSPSGLEPAGRP